MHNLVCKSYLFTISDTFTSNQRFFGKEVELEQVPFTEEAWDLWSKAPGNASNQTLNLETFITALSL